MNEHEILNELRTLRQQQRDNCNHSTKTSKRLEASFRDARFSVLLTLLSSKMRKAFLRERVRI